MGPVDAAPADLETVRRILREHAPGLEARAFGSRVSWTARETSDLDLALMTDEPLDAARMAALRSAFTDSRLPFRVDVVDWAGASDGFREAIESGCVTLVGKGERGTEEGWTTMTLGRFAPLAYGKGLKSDVRNLLGRVPVFGSNGQVGRHDKALTDGPTVIVGRKGTVGSVHYSPEPCWPIDTAFFISGGDAELMRFKYYALSALDLETMNTDSAVPGLNRDAFHAREIRTPPLPEQRAIARVLGTLDDKIGLNRRMNETLEAMAQAVFKSWFVDFAPVRAKAEGRDTGLPGHIADLFPDRLVDSELGEIPEGWAAVPLPDLIEINPARSLRRNAVAPYLDMANMPTKGHAPDRIIDRPFGSGMRFINGDTLVARITPCLENGKTAYVDFLEQGQVGWGSTEYIVLHPKPPLPCEFAYCLARGSRFREFAIRNMTGTSGRQRVSAKVLARFVLPSPPDTICSVFSQLIRPLIARARKAVNEARTLAALRDALLPKLVSGKVRLGEAVERLESAA